MLVLCTKVVTGDGEKWLNSGCILKIKPICLVDRSDVTCERGAKDNGKAFGLSSQKDGVAIN